MPDKETKGGYDDDGQSVSRNSNINGECFVAGAAFGGQRHPTVQHLRHWRDHHLTQRWLGRLGIRLYTKWGPIAARRLRQHPNWQPRVRRWLTRLAKKLP